MVDDQMADEDMIMDPRVLLTPPIADCPKCGGAKSYGVERVFRNRCTRLCVLCRYRESIDLPPLKKRIIYLDQFAVSEMAKASNAGHAGDSKPDGDTFWRNLLRILHGLRTLQVIVCPKSELHYQESEVDSRHLDFGSVYEGLSGGMCFESFLDIQCRQLGEHVKAWYQGDYKVPLVLNAEDITGRALHEWSQPARIIVQFTDWPKVGTETRTARDKAALEIDSTCQGLRDKGKFDFWQCFRSVVSDRGNAIIRACNKRARAHDLVAKGMHPQDLDDLSPSASDFKAHAIKDGLYEVGVVDADMAELIQKYLTSDALEYVPFIRISALLYTAQARIFASGRTKAVTGSAIADFEMIATLLPYCDAMFVDRECHSLLSDQPLPSQLGYLCQVFSTKLRDQFLAFLKELGRGVSPEHLAFARSVYGAKVDEIVTLFQDGNGEKTT
jgi:hypothetical protein